MNKQFVSPQNQVQAPLKFFKQEINQHDNCMAKKIQIQNSCCGLRGLGRKTRNLFKKVSDNTDLIKASNNPTMLGIGSEEKLSSGNESVRSQRRTTLMKLGKDS